MQAMGSPLGASPLAGNRSPHPRRMSPTNASTPARPLQVTRALFSPGASPQCRPGAQQRPAGQTAGVDRTPPGGISPSVSPPAAQLSPSPLQRSATAPLDCTPPRPSLASQPPAVSPFAMPSVQGTPLAAGPQPAGQQPGGAVLAGAATHAAPRSASPASQLQCGGQLQSPAASPAAGVAAGDTPMSVGRQNSGVLSQQQPAEAPGALATAASADVTAGQKRAAAPDITTTTARRRRSSAAPGSGQGAAPAGRLDTSATAADAVPPAKRHKPAHHEQATAGQQQRHQLDGPRLGCGSCRKAQSGCRKCRMARICWLQVKWNADHNSELCTKYNAYQIVAASIIYHHD
jgi:hypothetical protein